MELQDLKRWHWMLIGLLVGALWSATRLFYGPDVDGTTVTTQFEHALLARPGALQFVDLDEGSIRLMHLRVGPPVVDETPEARAASAKGIADSGKVQWVTGEVSHDRAFPDPNNRRKLTSSHTTTPFRFKAVVPYQPAHPRDDYVANDVVRVNSFFDPGYYQLPKPVPGYVKPHQNSYPSITDYLDELNRKYGKGTVSYRYAWWEARWAVMTIYPLAGLLVIGGVWPTVLQLLYGAGLGGKSKKEEEYDLSRFKGRSAPAAPKRVGMTDADRAQLAAVEAALEKNLQPSETVSPAKAGSGKPLEAEVRKLDGGSLEAKPEEKPVGVKTHGIGAGDYYPTEIHKETPPK
jgi:hypothetical protein